MMLLDVAVVPRPLLKLWRRRRSLLFVGVVPRRLLKLRLLRRRLRRRLLFLVRVVAVFPIVAVGAVTATTVATTTTAAAATDTTTAARAACRVAVTTAAYAALRAALPRQHMLLSRFPQETFTLTTARKVEGVIILLLLRLSQHNTDVVLGQARLPRSYCGYLHGGGTQASKCSPDPRRHVQAAPIQRPTDSRRGITPMVKQTWSPRFLAHRTPPPMTNPLLATATYLPKMGVLPTHGRLVGLGGLEITRVAVANPVVCRAVAGRPKWRRCPHEYQATPAKHTVSLRTPQHGTAASRDPQPTAVPAAAGVDGSSCIQHRNKCRHAGYIIFAFGRGPHGRGGRIWLASLTRHWSASQSAGHQLGAPANLPAVG